MTRSVLVGLLALSAASSALAQSRTIAPNEHLVVEGVPPIPAELADQVRRYTEYRSAGMSDWHPVRREMLIGTRFGNTAQVHRVKQPLGARTQLTFFEEPVGGSSYEPTAGEYFLFSKDVGGNEFSQIYRYDLATGESALLTDGGRSQNGGVQWAHAGHRIAYASTRRNGADRDIYIMDPRDRSTDRLVHEVKGGGWVVSDWSPDDRTLLLVELLSVNLTRLYLLDVASGTRTPLTPNREADTVSYGNAKFSKDGKGVWLTTDQDGEFRRLAYLDRATRAITPVTTGINWDVDGFSLSDDGRRIAFVANEAGVSRLYLLDTRTRRYQPVSSIPVGSIGGINWHPRTGELGLTLSTARTAADVYSLDPRTLTLTRWTESETAGLNTADIPDPELIRWKSFDGLEITGFYYRPPARFEGKRPVLINIHGGPEGQATPGFLGRNNYLLKELGIALILPNVRGSTGYGKSFVKLDNGMKREDSVRDIGALLDWVAAQPALDASKVMITGGSYGGYMTLAVATNYNDRICCSVDVVGISNFVSFLQNTEEYRRDLRRVEYGDERDPAMREYLERIAPLHNAAKITKPLFVVQGANDPRVPRSEAEQMVRTVQANGSPVWYLLAMDEGHGFRKKANADYQFYATLTFMRQFLLSATP